MPGATKAGSMSRPPRFWIALALLSAAFFVYAWLVAGPAPRQPGTEGRLVGRRLEYLRLEPLTRDQGSVTLEDLPGRVTLLNYWGTWCPPCLREFPAIEALAERFAARRDFRLYAVSCGQASDRDLAELRAATEAFLKSRGSKLPTFVDPGGGSRQSMVLGLGLDGMAYPTTLVLDRRGAIRGFWQGYDRRAADEMAGLIERLLAEADGLVGDVQDSSASNN